MAQVVQLLILIIGAIPKLKELWDQLLALYLQKQLEAMREEDREAIRKALNEHDQRQLEKQLFGKEKSEASGLPNTEFRKSLPNVGMPPEKS